MAQNNPDLTRVKRLSTGVLATAAVATAGVFGGLLVTGAKDSAAQTTAAATQAVTPNTGADNSDTTSGGWRSTPPLRNGGTSSHAGTGAS